MEACWKPAGRENHPETDTADLPPLEKELHIYNWSDYIAQDTVSNFEREFGVRVTYDTYESNEEMIAKLQAGATGYDIIVPTGYILPVLVATRLIAPLRRTYLTNSNNLSPIFQNLPDRSRHPVYRPVAVGHVGNRLPARQGDQGRWTAGRCSSDPRLGGKMTMMDDAREVIGAELRYRGHSLNSAKPARAGPGQAGRHRRQAAAQGLHLGAGEGPAGVGRCVGGAALERRHGAGAGGGAQRGLRAAEGGLHHLD